jgi:hypothetical protein
MSRSIMTKSCGPIDLVTLGDGKLGNLQAHLHHEGEPNLVGSTLKYRSEVVEHPHDDRLRQSRLQVRLAPRHLIAGQSLEELPSLCSIEFPAGIKWIEEAFGTRHRAHEEVGRHADADESDANAASDFDHQHRQADRDADPSGDHAVET